MRILLTSENLGYKQILEGSGHEVYETTYFPDCPTITEMRSRCPGEPDLILHLQADLVGLPSDYADSPVPVLPLSLDYQMNFQSLALAAPFFPALLLNGNDPVDFFTKAGTPLVDWYPHAHVDLKISSVQKERPIDVVFVGTVDQANGYEERAELMKLLLHLIPEYGIKIVAGSHKESVGELYSKSKMVFNQVAREDALNQRTLDALAAGSALLINEENRGTLDWLKGKKECIAYNPGNLLSLIRHYLIHPDERLSIAQSGQERFLGFRETHPQYRKNFLRLVEGIEWNIKKTPSILERLFASGLFVEPPKGFSEEQISEIEPLLLNNLGAAYWGSSNCIPSRFQEHEAYAKLAIRCLNQSVKAKAYFLPACWNLGIASFLRKQYAFAELYLKKALELVSEGVSWPFEAKNVTSFGTMDSFTRRFSRFFMEEKLFGRNNSTKIRGLVLSGIFMYLIEIAVLRTDYLKAQEWLRTWESLDKLDDAAREWIKMTTLQHTSEKDSFKVLSRIIDKRPFLFGVDQLQQFAYKFWTSGMKSECSKVIQQIFRRHLAGSEGDETNERVRELLSRAQHEDQVIESLSCLEEMGALNDIRSPATG